MSVHRLHPPPSHRHYLPPPPSSKHCHNTAAGSVLASLPALLIHCAKVKFCLVISTIQMDLLRIPPLSQTPRNEMFASVDVIVDFTETPRKKRGKKKECDWVG